MYKKISVTLQENNNFVTLLGTIHSANVTFLINPSAVSLTGIQASVQSVLQISVTLGSTTVFPGNSTSISLDINGNGVSSPNPSATINFLSSTQLRTHSLCIE